jgi:putative membrane-bound dehydrogenase-like protein
MHAAPVPLFDGKTLADWSAREGEEKWWRVQDGALTGGSLEERVPRNTFLVSDRKFENFDLTYQLRLVQGGGFQNSGLQIRSIRKPGSHEMIGYQVDAGIGYWGDLYDESRRGKLTGPLDAGALKAVVRDWDWNQFRVRCEGPRIRVWINGILVTDFTETDKTIPSDGSLGLQAHGGGKFLIQMKDVLITELPPTPGAGILGKPDTGGPREPKEQEQSFVLPGGFTAELVASEAQGLNKPITVAWDRHGRMWTMTAVEYPVDANEDREAAEALFAAGGRDRLLVFDEPNQPAIQTPRTFAEGLAIPLGLLPMNDGVLAHFGHEIRRYIGDESSGTAKRHETVLTGFGIQDSHLFPHQFERLPGGWIYVAQGAFNRSQVRRPCGSPFACGNAAVAFDHCKLARFKPDGSRFENLTGGPNNIWGLVISRLGETFIQEANDMGYPVAEFVPGKHYPTPFGPRLRDDAPVLPPSTRGSQMGGTGLSGLALAEDTHSPFANDPQGRQLFYLANPITNRIQTVSLARDANGHPIYEKGADFMLTDDTWFRPVAIHFGPDGCLYVVDWYNKIISHNEVPRTHPDRDKSRGRIWRIRHRSQPAPPRIDLAALPAADLLPLLGGPNARLSMMAWNEIGDRKATVLVPGLKKLATAPDTPPARRAAALWALEALGAITLDALLPAIQSTEPALRFEALRIAGETSLPEAELMRLLEKAAADTHFRVRTAIIQAMRDHASPTPAMLAAAASLVQPPLAGNPRDAYDREFDRYLVRWLLSGHPEATRELLAAGKLPVEAALVAARSFENPHEAARLFTANLPKLERPLLPTELTLLGQHLDDQAILKSLEVLLAGAASRTALLRAMSQLAPETAARPGFAALIGKACARLMAEDPSPENSRLVIDLARRFRIAALADTVRPWTLDPDRTPAETATGLAALREMAAATADDCLPFLDHAADALRREAVLALGSIDDPTIIPNIAARWPTMPATLRNLAVDGMVATRPKAEAFAAAITDGGFPDLDTASIEKILVTLGPENPAAARMLATRPGSIRHLIRLNGQPEDRIRTMTDLTGPFTVETWIKLDPGIDNSDGILGRKGGLDINFANGCLRVYGGPETGDLIIASRRIEPNVWVHCAITRDAQGRFTLYFDGEPDTAATAAATAPAATAFTGLNLGETTPRGGTAAYFEEFRVWNLARSAADILAHHRVSFENAEDPEGLVQRVTGHTRGLLFAGSAAVVATSDFPDLQTPEQQRLAAARFERFRSLANQPGDIARGKRLAQASCLICHQVQGEGIAIGPDLSGAGVMGIDSLLRNILAPNEQLESGYYRHDIRLTDGTFASGFLASESADSLTLRRIAADDLVIPRAGIASHQVAKRSLMPEGLIDGLTGQQVSDLFAYLLSLN